MARNATNFRRYARTEGSNWPLFWLAFLILLNVGLYGYVLHGLWRMVHPS